MANIHLPSLLRGASRLLDLGGTLDAHEGYDFPADDQAVYDALRGDWGMLGRDLRLAIEHERARFPALHALREDGLSDPMELDRPQAESPLVWGPNSATGGAPHARANREPGGVGALLYDLRAERSVIGSLLLDPDAIGAISQIVRPGDFHAEAHRIIFDVMLDLSGEHRRLTYVALAEELDRRDLTHLIGGRGYLPGLAAEVPTSIHAQYYAEIVSHLALLRRLVEASRRLMAVGAYDGRRLEEAVDDAEAELLALANQRRFRESASIGSIAASYRERTTAPLAADEKREALKDAISQAEVIVAQASKTVSRRATS